MATRAAACAGLLLLLTSCGEIVSGPLVDVTRNAEAAQLNVTAAPASYHQTGNAGAVRDLLLQHMRSTLARYYAGAALAEPLVNGEGSIAAMLDQHGGGRLGGLRQVELTDLRISGATARAKGRVTLWFKTAQFWWQDPQSFPAQSTVEDLELHFVKRNGVWTIDQESAAYAPGQGP